MNHPGIERPGPTAPGISRRQTRLKLWLVVVWVAAGALVMLHASWSQGAARESVPAPSQDEYVGSETCKGCHEDQFNLFAKTAHFKLTTIPGWPVEKQGCESCHGPGKAHVEGGGDKTMIRTFENESAKEKSDNCLSCHAGREEHNNYRRGEHWRNDVGCTDCHSPHFDAPKGPALESISHRALDVPLRGDSQLKMLKDNQPGLCIKCHNEVRSHFSMPFRHRVMEGIMKCSDCHNPHGGFEQKQTRAALGADITCVKCHTDKQGPFVYEHAPLKVEGCTICHTPHGATNSKMLKRNDVNQLCIECHSSIGTLGSPNTPSFHNLATSRYQNCTICHVKIHGSQSHPFFFR